MDKEKSNALADQYKKVKSEGSDEKKKKPKGSFLGGDVDIETLSPMKFEKKDTERKRTPEEIEAVMRALSRPTQKPQTEGPSLMERAKETASAIYEINAARRAGDLKRLGKAMKSDYKGF